MTLPAHPQARLSDARGNCAQNPAQPHPALFRLLLALLATVLGHPRTGLRILFRASAALPALALSHPDHAWTADLWDEEEGEETIAWTQAATAGFWAPLRGWHADCDPSILYVIGPPPNRGMRALQRPHPPARPTSARAPPPPRSPPHAPVPAHFPPPQGPPPHAPFVPLP